MRAFFSLSTADVFFASILWLWLALVTFTPEGRMVLQLFIYGCSLIGA
jgi:hypothetical protein